MCSDPAFEECATKALHDRCSFDGGSGNCDIGSCFDADGGLHFDSARLFCEPNLGISNDGGGADADPDAAADAAAPYVGSDAEVAIGDFNDAGVMAADDAGDAGDAPGAFDGSAPASGCSAAPPARRPMAPQPQALDC